MFDGREESVLAVRPGFFTDSVAVPCAFPSFLNDSPGVSVSFFGRGESEGNWPVAFGAFLDGDSSNGAPFRISPNAGVSFRVTPETFPGFNRPSLFGSDCSTAGCSGGDDVEGRLCTRLSIPSVGDTVSNLSMGLARRRVVASSSALSGELSSNSTDFLKPDGERAGLD